MPLLSAEAKEVKGSGLMGRWGQVWVSDLAAREVVIRKESDNLNIDVARKAGTLLVLTQQGIVLLNPLPSSRLPSQEQEGSPLPNPSPSHHL